MRFLVISFFVGGLWSVVVVADAAVLFSVGGFCEGASVQQHEDLGPQGGRLGPHVPQHQSGHAHHLHSG